MHNALAHVGPKQPPAVVAMLKAIFAQDRAKAAREQWASVGDTLCERYPKLAGLMDDAREHWPQFAAWLAPASGRGCGSRQRVAALNGGHGGADVVERDARAVGDGAEVLLAQPLDCGGHLGA